MYGFPKSALLLVCAIQIKQISFGKSIGNGTSGNQTTVIIKLKNIVDQPKSYSNFSLEIERIFGKSEFSASEKLKLKSVLRSPDPYLHKSETRRREDKMYAAAYLRRFTPPWDREGNFTTVSSRQRRSPFNQEGIDEDIQFLSSGILEQIKNSLVEKHEAASLDTANGEKIPDTIPIPVTNHVSGFDLPAGEPTPVSPVPFNPEFDEIMESSTHQFNQTGLVSTAHGNEEGNKTKITNLVCQSGHSRTHFNIPESTTQPIEDLTGNMTTLVELDNEGARPCYIADGTNVFDNSTQFSNDTVNGSSTLTEGGKFPPVPLPLPAYFDDLLGKVVKEHEVEILEGSTGHAQLITSNSSSNASVLLNEVIPANSTIVSSDPLLDDFLEDFEFTGSSGESGETNLQSPPMLMNILEGITAPSEVDPIFSPVVFINGTRNGLIRFVRGFNRLTIVIQITIVIVITIVIIIIGNGVYQSTPTNLFWAIVASQLPILLMLLLQNAGLGRRKSRNLVHKNENNESHILTLLYKGIMKYDT